MPASHEPIAILLDFANPIIARWGRAAGDGRHGSIKPEGAGRGREDMGREIVYSLRASS